jgi:hypothetical protein
MPEIVLNPPPYHRNDMLEAAPDFLALTMGLRVPDPHPIALRMAGGDPQEPRFRPVDLAGGLAGLPTGTSGALVTRSLTDGDFAYATASAYSRSCVQGFENITRAEVDPFVIDIARPNFKRLQVPKIEFDLPMTSETGDFDQWTALAPDGGVSVAATFVGYKFLISRELWINQEQREAARRIGQMGAGIGRWQASRLAMVLEDGTTPLSDGNALIVSDNTVSGGMTAAGLGAALAKLRSATDGLGNPLNLRGELVLCHPDDEVTLLSLVAAMTPQGQPARLTVVPNAWLTTSGECYVFASPLISPVVARTFVGPGPLLPSVQYIVSNPTFTDPETGDTVSHDGVLYRAEIALQLAAIDRAGVVKLGT